MSGLPEPVSVALQAVGAATLGVALLRTLSFLYAHFLRPAASFKAYAGSWAVVTGASAGIGAGFARRLAARGLNVVLIARSQGKMDAVADACRASGVRAETWTFDYAGAGPDDYARLAADVGALPGGVGVLVNNVGVNVEYPTEFSDMEAEDVDRIVKVNIEATNRMTAMVLPGMRAAKRGLVYCMSSGGGAVAPAPLLAVYGGTKAYNDTFAVSLAGEVARDGVCVHSLTPFFVESAMAKMRASVTVPTAESFAENALRQAGGKIRANPHWAHAVMAAGLTALPHGVQVTRIAKLHQSIRKRALRKAARKAKQG